MESLFELRSPIVSRSAPSTAATICAFFLHTRRITPLLDLNVGE